MNRRAVALGLIAAALVISSCAVKKYPRDVTLKEKAQTNYAHSFDTMGAVLISQINAGPGYDITRQEVKIDYSYYLDPKFKENPRLFYPDPGVALDVETVEKIDETPDAEVFLIKWPSKYRPQNPAFAPVYATYVEDQTAWGVYVKSKKGNRAAMVISHGWTGPEVTKSWKGERMMDFAAAGYDTVLIQQPYHGLRAPADSKYSGEYFVTGEVSHINEALCQTVTDVRSMVKWLREKYEVVGIKGGSLGGITTLLVAANEPEIDFAAAWVPPSSLSDIPEDTPLAPQVVKGMRNSGITREMANDILYVASPANFQPAIDKINIIIFAGMGDNFVPPDQPMKVWEAWGEPEIVWFAGGHVLNFESRECIEREKKFIIARLPG